MTQGASVLPSQSEQKKKRKHRGGKRKKNRRQSFAASDVSALQSAAEGMPDPLVQVPEDEATMLRGSDAGVPQRRDTDFYAMRRNLSNESLDSEVLLDHRTQPAMRPRRDSRLMSSHFTALGRSPGRSNTHLHSPSGKPDSAIKRRHKSMHGYGSDGEDEADPHDRTPLLTGGQHRSPEQGGWGLSRSRSHTSDLSSASKKNRRRGNTTATSFPKYTDQDYDVNNPPSVPPSPGLDAHPDDVMFTNGDFLTRSPDSRRNFNFSSNDAFIDIDGDRENHDAHSAPPSPRLKPDGLQRNRTLPVEGDVCFPHAHDEESEMADDDLGRVKSTVSRHGRRRRRGEWPQIWALDEWALHEKEERDGDRRAKKISEPVLVEGRLRPTKQSLWHRDEEAAPYRYTYFCEEFESTIHAQSISELVQPGGISENCLYQIRQS